MVGPTSCRVSQSGCWERWKGSPVLPLPASPEPASIEAGGDSKEPEGKSLSMIKASSAGLPNPSRMSWALHDYWHL